MGAKAPDMTGQRFGRLLVLERVPRPAPALVLRPSGRTAWRRVTGPAKWHCLCDCGRIATVGGNALRSGFTRSCGCLRRESTAERSRQMTAARRGAERL